MGGPSKNHLMSHRSHRSSGFLAVYWWNTPLLCAWRILSRRSSCFTLIALYWSIKVKLSKIIQWILSTAGALQSLSSNIVSAVYIQCQSQRTRSKENWHSVWLNWCHLKPHPGVPSNPQCTPFHCNELLLPSSISSFACDWSAHTVDIHWLFSGGWRGRDRQRRQTGREIGAESGREEKG